MQTILKIILIGSILLNVVAIWGFFHYIRYGGSPLGEIKRMLTGSTDQRVRSIPFEEENAAVKQKLAAEGRDPKSVVFFGASITNRWDLERDFPAVNVINRGLGGQLAGRMLDRFHRDVIELQPQAVVIKFCSINFRPHTATEQLRDIMTMMVDLAEKHDITPIVATVIPAAKAEAHIGTYHVADSLNAYNAWLRDFAQQRELPLIDYADAIADDEGYLPRSCSTDPVHVNERGYGILAEAARPVIYRVLDVSQPAARTER